MKYMTFNGRLGRGGYIAAIFVASTISAVIFVALWFFEILDEESARWVMYLTAALLMICPSVQRLHDIDHSGAGLLFALIPGFNLGLGLYLLLKPGTPGPNLYVSCAGQADAPSGDFTKEFHPYGPPGRQEPSGIHDDAFYDEVAKEMQENRLIPGVWARAFAEADGDGNRAKAIYIKLRVAKISADYLQKKAAQSEGEGATQKENLEKDRQAKAFAQWQSEKKDLGHRIDMEGKSELFKAQFEVQDEGCRDDSSAMWLILWVFMALVVLSVIAVLTEWNN